MNKELYKLKTNVLKALSHPIRLMIIDNLRHGEKTVSELVRAINEEQSNISKHLGILKTNGLISDRKAGLNVFYSLKVQCITDLFCCLDSMIEENIKYQQNLLDSSKLKNGL